MLCASVGQACDVNLGRSFKPCGAAGHDLRSIQQRGRGVEKDAIPVYHHLCAAQPGSDPIDHQPAHQGLQRPGPHYQRPCSALPLPAPRSQPHRIHCGCLLAIQHRDVLKHAHMDWDTLAAALVRPMYSRQRGKAGTMTYPEACRNSALSQRQGKGLSPVQMSPIQQGLRDAHPYVRRTAVMGVLKVYHLDELAVRNAGETQYRAFSRLYTSQTRVRAKPTGQHPQESW